MNEQEVKRRVRSEMAKYGASLRRQRMLETESKTVEDEFYLDDPEEDDEE